MRRTALTAAAAILLGSALGACGSAGRAPAPAHVPVALALVELWRGRHVSAADREVAQLRPRLSSLAGSCRTSEAAVAATIEVALRAALRDGLRGTPLELAQSLQTVLRYEKERGRGAVSCPYLALALVQGAARPGG